jgi:WhiB family redox-sensing transcriptional regulator
MHTTTPTTTRTTTRTSTRTNDPEDFAVNISFSDIIIATPDHARSIVAEPREPDSPRPPGPVPVARCADGHGTLTALFFSDNLVDIARAKAMCARCPLQVSCLAGALEREEPWGVWGGELLSGGRIVANKRPCGRPPKHPRPALVVDELGPVAVA